MEFESTEDYVNYHIDKGYLYPDGGPKKCINCDGENFKQVDADLLDGWRDVLEYSMKCNDCNKIIGHWAYGYWQL